MIRSGRQSTHSNKRGQTCEKEHITFPLTHWHAKEHTEQIWQLQVDSHSSHDLEASLVFWRSFLKGCELSLIFNLFVIYCKLCVVKKIATHHLTSHFDFSSWPSYHGYHHSKLNAIRLGKTQSMHRKDSRTSSFLTKYCEDLFRHLYRNVHRIYRNVHRILCPEVGRIIGASVKIWFSHD